PARAAGEDQPQPTSAPDGQVPVDVGGDPAVPVAEEAIEKALAEQTGGQRAKGAEWQRVVDDVDERGPVVAVRLEPVNVFPAAERSGDLDVGELHAVDVVAVQRLPPRTQRTARSEEHTS